MSAPMALPRKEMSAFCGRMRATELWFAGPRHDIRVSSQMLHITRFVLTETPDPELDPSEAARVVSYGVAGLPDPLLRLEASVGRSTSSRTGRPPGGAGMPFDSWFASLPSNI